MIHGTPCWQLQLLKCAKKHQFHLKVVRAYGVLALTGRPAAHRAKPACEEELRPGVPRVLQGDVRRVLQGERIGWNDHAFKDISGHPFLIEIENSKINDIPIQSFLT